MKKNILLYISVIYLFLACSGEKEVYIFTSFHEPANEGLRYLVSEDGYHWDSIPGIWLKPTVGTQKLMRDPSIVQTPDSVFHLVWTSSWRGDLGFGYSKSKDLVHWSEPRMIPVMAYDTTTVNVWAPEIYYDRDSSRFIVVWASCVPGKFDCGIEEEKNNHRLYYITTKDFETISETKLFYDPGFSVIDAVIVRKGVEDYVLVMKDNTRPERNLKVAFSKWAIGPYSEASEPFTSSFVEGPSVVKVDEDYLIYFDVYRDKIYGAMRTHDFVNFENITTTVSLPSGHKHGTIIKVRESSLSTLLGKSK